MSMVDDWFMFDSQNSIAIYQTVEYIFERMLQMKFNGLMLRIKKI